MVDLIISQAWLSFLLFYENTREFENTINFEISNEKEPLHVHC